jgi:GNAT superfamily N-acetyltransferase
MASTERPIPNADVAVEKLGELTPDAVAMLGELVVHSGWNQTAQDWGVFFSCGTIYVVRDEQGRIAASGAVLPMGESRPGALASLTGRGVAWISMILVRPDRRGQGLAGRVFKQCLRDIRDHGRIAMLDATPQGEGLYLQFGFEPLWRLTRWRREARPATGPELPLGKPDLDTLAELDQEALGFARKKLLGELLGRPDSRYIRHVLGFAIVRAGRVAHQIGPLVATDEPTAVAVMREAAAALSGPVLIDVPDDRPLLRQALADAGFAPQRGFARMALATAEQRIPQGQTHFIHAIAGPEFA